MAKVRNLPETPALVDEAKCHESPEEGFEPPLEHVRQAFFVSWAMRGEQVNETNVVCGNTGSCFIPSLGSRFMPKNRHKVRKAGLQSRLPKYCDSAIMLRAEGKVLEELFDKVGLGS